MDIQYLIFDPCQIIMRGMADYFDVYLYYILLVVKC